MKVFVSWSGKLSRAIAQTLKQWLPCMIQSLEIFFSPEDIEKGSNWDVQISSELSQCKYGIICLTNDNISAPWINFEAGALAKELDSHISALMVNIKPSDIKGPLARYQSTKLEKTDFFQLINNINALQEKPLDASVLQNIFDSLWDKMESEFARAVQQSGQAADCLPIPQKSSRLRDSRGDKNHRGRCFFPLRKFDQHYHSRQRNKHR